MVRAPDSGIKQVKAMYLKDIKLVEVVDQLNLSEGTVRRWKYIRKWDSERSDKKSERSYKKGSPKGSKNALGNRSDTVPEQDKNAEKHGFFSKYLPEETVPVIQGMPTGPLDIPWDQVQIAHAVTIRAQPVMYVKDRDDVTTTRIGHKDGDTVTEERWEVQQAWDKQGNFLQAQARV